MPSAKDFAEALQRLPQPTEGYRRFLHAHAKAPARTSTATLLAEAAGYEAYNAINLHYGKLAIDLAREMKIGYDPGFALLVDFVRPKTVTNEHWLLMMRSEFAEGLALAGWIE